MKIGIIGTGIAGLSAAWLFNRAGHRVTLYEKHHTLGMDAHSITFEQKGVALRTDVPPRIFNVTQWPNLLNLYREVGVAFDPIDPSQSFCLIGQPNFLNVDVAYQPQVPDGSEITEQLNQIMNDIARLALGASQDLADGLSAQTTLADYLQRQDYSQAFITDFLYPILASTVCTCSYDSLNAYPAPVILETLLNLFGSQPLLRTKYGAQDVVRRLSRGIDDIRYGTEVCALEPTPSDVRLETTQGKVETFDHLIVATQANQALDILSNPSETECKMLSSFSYDDVPIIVHQDSALMPVKRKKWAHINLLIAPDRRATMCSVLMNRFNPDWQIDQPIIQTINPLIEPQPETIIAQYNLQRPVVNEQSLAGLDLLKLLHQKAGRRIWFCGSYAAEGVPLLESAVLSVLRVANRLLVPIGM
ncbi:FAD-dependent oxidoreductase [Desulfobacula sp.]|uniref:FAD-dependent oxidoreductase n=1 Tax=Desulfobacula sp. TaxID=2593537 RepID=UPI002621C8FB|nr:FAD-dependent oxidoreductase [Desulfobacula sp.]